ncbi:MAG: CsiV family protein [Gammaproteobacteria bacterium]|nr:CsiV family protein [Gammaproteobacteria bacterium]
MNAETLFRTAPRALTLLCIAAIIVAAVSSTAYAQTPVEEPQVKLYQVDVVVFRNIAAAPLSSESWPDAFPELTDDDMLDPANPKDLDEFLAQLDTQESAELPENELTEPDLLPPDTATAAEWFELINDSGEQRGLTKEQAAIEKSTDYELLLYATWRQEVGDKDTAEAFDLANIEIPAPLLSGSFRLYQERFLHIEVKLNLVDNETHSFTIDQSRRLQGEKTQYFDHPMFSVITLVAEVTPAEDRTNN